ncbi:glycerol-3-phosphate 1-O-acyltransferase PlsY [Paracandidimonas soli]|uniref:Glycerol-3-phosphate acyltransferase n=1 Tax=Paracandidimonas soli TaxID=1917182 RepID=A0A4R3VCL1_9BURK|nr:glycerol-3-phosphate 1-O-acyltransferase PlsY [Paracandidimonas soli]TCV01573.1 acyl-phosphate glycerol-3-phosphate acyltransferase [Paracandidimonas soli]
MTSSLSVLSGLVVVLLSYLAGSIPFAVVVSRLMGLKDPRTFGSGNPGATNVLRTGNKTAAILTLLGDMAKGLVAVCAAGYLQESQGLPDWVFPASALAVFLGHLYPLFLKFKGGKGVATALGVLLAISPWLGLATAATWLIVAYATRYSSLAALLAAVFAPLYHIFGSNVAWERDTSVTLAIFIISALLISRHGANIQRLLQGKESRIGEKKKTR